MDPFLTWGLEEQTPEHGSEVPTALKSEEELAKFTVDESLSDTERTVLFLNGGQVIQQKHAIVNLQNVIRARGRQGWESIAGPLKTALNRLDTDCQIEAADVFALVAKERLMPPADLQACLLPTIVRNINREKSEEETEAWMHALFELLPMLDKETLRSEVLSMALSKGDMEDNVASRVICARILGGIALYMTKDEVERTFFKRAVKMCQDVDYMVRLSSTQQLAAIGRTAGKEAVQRTVLDELFELLKDEDMQVRAAAFTSLVQLLDLIPPDVRKARLMPVLRDYAMPFDLDAIMQRCVAKNFGHMFSVIKSDMDSEDIQMFCGCFKHFASKPDAELRRSCAQQLGQVVKAAISVQPTAYQLHFSETFHAFTADFDEEVRLAAATQLPELARCTGKDMCCQLMTRPLVQLLRDESRRVHSAVLPALTQTLQQFAADRSSLRQASLDEIVRALMDLEANSNRNWRLQVSLASAFPTFHHVFSSDQIYEHFLPMAFRFISNSAAAARPSAAEGIACILRYNKKEKQKAELFLQLIREYARGKCYTQRLAFAEVCKYMVKRFSSKFVKEWVFDLCLELLYDPVPNVRLQVTYILPSLKQTVRLPEDVDLLERLNNAISNSMTDNDRDVSQTARQINDTYKRMPVRMGGSAGTLIDASGGALAAYEAEDKKKEAEEAECNFSAEDVKEIKAEIVQMSYKKKPGQAGEPVGKSAINRRADMGKPGALNSKSSGSGVPPSSGIKAGTGIAAGSGRLGGAAATAAAPPTTTSGRLAPPSGAAARKPEPSRPSAGPVTAAAPGRPGALAKPAPAVSAAPTTTTVSSTVRSVAGVAAAKPGPFPAAVRAGVPAPKPVVTTTIGGAAAAVKRK